MRHGTGRADETEAPSEARALLDAISGLFVFCPDSVPILKVALIKLCGGLDRSHNVTDVAYNIPRTASGNGHDAEVVSVGNNHPRPKGGRPKAGRPKIKPGKPRREPIEERLTDETWNKLRTLVVGAMETLRLTPSQVTKAAGLPGSAAWRYLSDEPPNMTPTARTGDALKRWFESQAKDREPAEAGSAPAPFRRSGNSSAGTGAAAAA